MDFGSFCYMYKQKFSHATLVIAKYCGISFNSNQLWRVTQKLELRYSYIGRADRDTRKNSYIRHVPLGRKTFPAWGNRWIWSWEEAFKVCWINLVLTQLFWRFLKQNMQRRRNWIFGSFFTNFVTCFACSKIPSVTRDMYENFRIFCLPWRVTYELIEMLQ